MWLFDILTPFSLQLVSTVGDISGFDTKAVERTETHDPDPREDVNKQRHRRRLSSVLMGWERWVAREGQWVKQCGFVRFK